MLPDWPLLTVSLLQDIEWAAAHAPKEERASFAFSKILFVSQVALAEGAPSGGGASSSEAAPRPSKKRKKASADAQMELLDSLEFVRPEEQLIASSAEWCALLNATGRSRQLLVVITPDALRGTLPALTALMGA